jgi:hypothetical protein
VKEEEEGNRISEFGGTQNVLTANKVAICYLVLDMIQEDNNTQDIMDTPPLPQPQLDRRPITSDQYEAYTPEKLELWQGFYNYGGQDFTGFYLAVLANMGLREAVRHVPLSLWLEAIQELALQNPKLNFDNEVGEAMLNRLNRGLEDLQAVAEYLEEQG